MWNESSHSKTLKSLLKLISIIFFRKFGYFNCLVIPIGRNTSKVHQMISGNFVFGNYFLFLIS